MSDTEDLEKPVYYKRVACREEGKWFWFSDPVAFTALNFLSSAPIELEIWCGLAYGHFAMKDIAIAQAPNLEAFDNMDWEAFTRVRDQVPTS